MPLKFLPALLILLPATSLFARAGVIDDLFYQEHPSSITITGCSQSASGTVTVPATINAKPVTEIRDSAFSMCSFLTSVDIQAPITTIGDQTFHSCRKLQSITLPPTLTSIGSEAFYSCWELTNVTLPSTVSSIDREAFFNCKKLTAVTLPDRLSYIGEQAFAYCGLTSLVFPASLETLGNHAFLTCQDLKKATFLGNAPGPGYGFFNEAASGFTIYYYEGRSGFGSPTWRGFPCKKLAPEIAVLQPLKTDLPDGVSTRNFGRAKAGRTGSYKTFTIRNTGKLPLSVTGVSITGKQARNFILTSPAQNMIEPGQDAKFKVTFKPRAAGTQKAVVRIKSNDRDESSFEINLTGTGTTK